MRLPRPAAVRRAVRLCTYALVALGLGYLAWRFDSHTLPESGCSPLLRFAPGSALLLDRRAERYAPGDALLFRAPDGLVYLALVDEVRAEDGALWTRADNPACQGRGSELFGWIPPEDRVARVVMVWPW